MDDGREDSPGGKPARDVTEARESRPRERSRRDFLRAGGLTAAGFIAGAAAGGAVGAAIAGSVAEGSPGAAPDVRDEPGLAHVVVLMGENRSFDNMFGWLYTPDTLPAGRSFEGLAFGDYSNPAPDGTPVPAHVYSGATDTIMGLPNPDPGEEYPHVNTQLFGIVDPAENSRLWVEEMSHPYNSPSVGATPTMDGFLRDYRINYERLNRGTAPTDDQANQIMGGFSPDMLPVLSTLAREFAVFDHWFAAVPSQTYCNRSFFHASTSHGFVTNKHGGGYGKWLDADPAPTIFNRLEEAGQSWRIYFDELQLVSLTGVMHAPVLEEYWKTGRFAYMTQFFEDAASGALPAYAFIEPRMVYNHNDFHPPFGALRESDVDGEYLADSAVSDVRAGEALVASVYDAIRTSSAPNGSNALNTLLLITFDEHGGTYDHVPPPTATPPHADAPAGEMGFTFDRLGARVPAIAVSAYTRAGTIIQDEMHHAAVIRTLCRLHGLQPLTRRDAAANDLFSVVNLDAPRDPATWPLVHPMWVQPNAEEDSLADLAHGKHRLKPLSQPGKGLLGLLLARYGPPDAPEPQTYADAYEVLRTHGLGLFFPKTDATPAATPSPSTASPA
ncbi:alkaline phosphatase family protein [Microbacterium sp. NPDC078428]|uniref:alkaline phosphatase family protein n=1 Tax=Microbacterium sp. NPDC078428 TaxID=3364190 RepID=UPI0037CB2F4C